MLIEVPVAELIDKISILKIKSVMILDPAKNKNIAKELSYLEEKANELAFNFKSELYDGLYTTNYNIWLCEEMIRDLTRQRKFDKEFTACAVNIHRLNDKRAEIKRKINLLYHSEFIEEKSYE